MARKRHDRRSPERTKTDKEARLAPKPAKKGAVVGQRARADRAVDGERATADEALRRDLEVRADALEALLVHERAATDAYLLTERVRSDKDVSHRDDFLGMVAHDVRNLLNGVVLNLELLAPAAAAEADPKHSGAAARIRRDVARMNRLIGDLVDVTSIDAGKLAVDHGGRIWAESKIGKGSQFYFTVPVTRSRPRRSTARIARDKTRPKPRARAVSRRGRR